MTPKSVRCPYCDKQFPAGRPFRRHLRICGMGRPNDTAVQIMWASFVMGFAVVLWLVTRQL